MNKVLSNSDIEKLLKKITLAVADSVGKEYLNLCINEFTRELGFASCCIYKIVDERGLYVCDPQFISSDDYASLLKDFRPGAELINKVIAEQVYIESNYSHSLLSTDEFLSKQNAQSVAGFLLKDLHDQPQGVMLLVDDKGNKCLETVKLIVLHYINRINSELERISLHNKIQKKEMDLHYLVETSRDLIWEINQHGIFIKINRSSMTMYGYQPEEMLGRHFSEFMPPDDAQEFETYLQQSIKTNGIYDIVAHHRHKNGKQVQVIYNAKPKADLCGNYIGYCGTTTDITQSVRAQIAIKNKGELFSAILSRLPVVFFSIDEDGTLLDIRGKGLQRMGVSDMEWVGKPGYGLFVGMDEMINSALSGETVHFESKGTLEGEPWWFYTSMFFDSWSGYGAVGFAVDITEQKQSEEILLHLLKDNRKLAQRLVEVQEEERRILARELHDELGQSITAVKSLATAITASAGNGYSEVRSLGNSIIDLSGRLYEVVNRLMRRLRPDILDSLGFEATINSCIFNSQLEKMGVNCNLRMLGEMDGLDEVVQITVYRIVQECLTNISKYAMASNIDILIERKMLDMKELAVLFNRGSNRQSDQSSLKRDLLIIEVTDDGIGMDASVDMLSSETDQKMGLQGIKERVTALGGKLLIEGQLGQGVKIKAYLDLATRSKPECDVDDGVETRNYPCFM